MISNRVWRGYSRRGHKHSLPMALISIYPLYCQVVVVVVTAMGVHTIQCNWPLLMIYSTTLVTIHNRKNKPIGRYSPCIRIEPCARIDTHCSKHGQKASEQFVPYIYYRIQPLPLFHSPLLLLLPGHLSVISFITHRHHHHHHRGFSTIISAIVSFVIVIIIYHKK